MPRRREPSFFDRLFDTVHDAVNEAAEDWLDKLTHEQIRTMPAGERAQNTRARNQRAPRQAETYYDLLGVSQNAPVKIIGAAYKVLAREYHPDTGDGDEEMMQRINEAWEVLKDAKKRKLYDQSLATRR